MNRRTLTFATIALLSFAVALATGNVAAQQTQRVSFKTPAANSKYTVQHVLDVGDVPATKCVCLNFAVPFRPTLRRSTA
jgi:hypothetical protein